MTPTRTPEQVCAERMHYSAEHLATTAASLIALSHGDPEPMVAATCRTCGEWCITMEGTGVGAEDRPSRATRASAVATRQAVDTARPSPSAARRRVRARRA